LTSIRLALLGTTDLSFDEAHYWMWSQRLAPAYFSKGPGIAFAMRASTALFGATEFGVRFWSPIFGATTSLLLFYFTRRLFTVEAAVWVVLALNATPIFNLGNLLMTIDPLSVFFWTAAMFAFWRAIERIPALSWWWPATGLVIGLGALCKYTNALELLSVFIVLALAPRLRREFRRPGLYLLLAPFALCLLPPVMWNADHAWATVTHLRSRGDLEHTPGLHPAELLEFIALHFATYSPVLFAALAWAVVASWRRARQQFKLLFLMWFGLPIFLFYLLLSINSAASPNWDALAFVSLLVLAVTFWREKLEGRRRARWLACGFAVSLLMSAVALDTDLLRSAGISLRRNEPADKMRGWRMAAHAVEDVRHQIEARTGEKLFVIADERDRASEFAFYFRDKRREGPGHPPVYIPESQDIRNQFSFWPRYDEFVAAPSEPAKPEGEIYTEENGINPFLGRSALYVQQGGKTDVPHSIRSGFGSVENVATIEVRRFNQIVRRFDVFLCRNYRTLPL
jgi:hypothetical protein